MTSHELRQAFLDFFAERGHTVVPSSSLIPHDDPTLLFTNAGMNQFKAVLLGQERRSYVRAASAQKCMRVSGKHNDLEAVGRDGRHHTFFEMLGNWSFGDYYKREAIGWAWEFLVDRLKLDAQRLWATVYKDDDESVGFWRERIGLSPARIVRLGDLSKGDEENFWSMGETGPCGPCTEIIYDQGEARRCGPRCGIGLCDCDRYLEIWNLVFIQFDRDAAGSLSPLPLQSVDTGMGLERVAALKAGVATNYGTDLFTPIIDWVAAQSGASPADPESRVSMQVIADHARALTFTVADGGRPGNDGRGYVLRRILRRAARHGRRLGLREPFLHAAAGRVIELMGGHYHELYQRRDHVLRVIQNEEVRFNETLDRGLLRFDEIEQEARRSGGRVIPGRDAFLLHDTFGFPLDLTQVMAQERGLTVDAEGFQQAMAEQRERARAASRFGTAGPGAPWRWLDGGEPGVDRPASVFVGYHALATPCRIIGIRPLEEAGRYEVVLDRTPFYAEAGGQVGDQGTIEGEGLLLRVLDTVQGQGGPVARVELDDGDLERVADLAALPLVAQVDPQLRRATMRNHTATHLLHAALRRQLGEHAQQAGSLVNAEKLRFDFHHDGPLSRDRLDALEEEVNVHILEDRAVTKHIDVPLAQARQMGAIAMFGEKYGDKVRVIEVPGVSVEFCGGTHCDHTGEIGLMRITGESSVAAGVRRIEAVTGEAALRAATRDRDLLRSLGDRLAARPEEVELRVAALQAELKTLQAERLATRRQQASGLVDGLLASATLAGTARVVASQVQVADRDSLLQLGDSLREQLRSGVAVLAAELDGKVSFLAVVTDDLVRDRGLKAGDLIKEVAAVAGGSGGGKPHMAQAGAKDPSRVGPALERGLEWVRARLAG